MWVRGAILGVLLLMASSGWVSAQASSRCARISDLPPLEVHMTVSEPRMDYRHDVDLLGLPRIGNSLESRPAGGKILGLTLHGEGFVYKYREKWIRQGDGPYCHYLISVDGELTLSQMTVYVASNYPVGSCEYNEVLEHENTHVRITRGMIDRYTPRLERALRMAAREINPVVTTEQSGQEEIARRLNAEIRPVLQQFRAETAQANAVIDTPDNYRKTTARCKNW